MSTETTFTASKADAIKALSNRMIIEGPGKYNVKVTSCGTLKEPKTSADGKYKQIAVANFNAINEFQVGKAKALLANGEYTAAYNVALTLSVLEGRFRPVSGELVTIIVDEIVNKDGDLALLVSSMSEIKAISSKKRVDFSLEDDLVAETEDVTSMD